MSIETTGSAAAEGSERRPGFRLPFWVISDTHFFHGNIARYASRPENHERLIRERWRELISDGARIVHLGDLALGKREQLERLDLPGRKHLVLGNHDRRGKRLYRELGFQITKPFVLEWRG